MGAEVGAGRPRRRHAAWLLAAALALTAWLAASGFPRLLDAQIHDRLTRPAASPSDVVLVDIDEASLAQLGPWPWPRPVLAQLAERLRERGARLQVWDIFLPEVASGDAALRDALAATGPAGGAPRPDVVLGQVLVLDPLVQAPPRVGVPVASSGAPRGVCADIPAPSGHFGLATSLAGVPVGHLSATPAVDGGLRRLPAVVCHEGRAYPQLTLAAAELLEPEAAWVRLEGQPLLGPAAWLERGSLRFALDAQGFLPVPYRRHHTQWPAISALRVLEDAPPVVPDLIAAPPSLQGKVVLVGATALGLADAARTPFHAHAPGVSVHAELMAAALDGRWRVAPSQPVWAALLVVGLAGLGLVAALPRLSRPAWLGAACAAALAVPLALAVLWRLADIVWPVTAPSAGLALFGAALAALQADAARRQAVVLARHLESFLPPDLAREIARQHPSGESLGRPETGAVLAVRVAGLDRWSASVDGLKALGLIHALSSLAERHARLQGGTLEHLRGDTLLLAWPAAAQALGHHATARTPRHPPHPPLRQPVQLAVQAARGLAAEMGALLAGAESERHPLSLRAAIDAGAYLQAVAGPRSSRRALVLGPAVDSVLALLPLCDELASPLLMGQRAADTAPGCALQPMGHFLLPDSGQPQPVHRVEP